MYRYKNKYRIESARWQQWNYSNVGAYFITICTKNRQHFFGNCANGYMCLNDVGKLAWQYWLELPQHFPHVQLGEFVVVSNHIYGIIIINTLPDVETLQFGLVETL